VDPILQLEGEWPSLSRGALAEALPGWRGREPALARFESPACVLASLRRGSSANDATLLALLRLASSDPLAGRLCLQAILPALKSQAARLARGSRRREELWELLLAHAWEAIRLYPAARERRVAANLVLEVLHQTTRELRRQERGTGVAGGAFAAVELEQARAFEAPAVAHPCGAEGLVRSACERTAAGRADAELILLTRLDGRRLQQLAELQGTSYDALRKRRQRAEERLRAQLGHDRAGDPTCPKEARCGP
jgi:DNA-directed RNA polymerase specialized sigma24 family protein